VKKARSKHCPDGEIAMNVHRENLDRPQVLPLAGCAQPAEL
jgi:hypothetical protein